VSNFDNLKDVEIPFEIRVRWQIWESFVSLLRSYAAAAGPEYTVHSFSDRAKVEHKERAVRFCLSPTSGDVAWQTVRPEMDAWGSFHINEDGTFEFPQGPEVMDMATIEWIAWLGRDEQSGRSLPDTIKL
jgi:hypothetical protein